MKQMRHITKNNDNFIISSTGIRQALKKTGICISFSHWILHLAQNDTKWHHLSFSFVSP